jgi:hypothetical protein
MRVLLLLAFVQFSSSITQAQPPVPPPQRGPHVPRVLIVGEKPELVGQTTLMSRYALKKRLAKINVSVIEVPDESQIDAVQNTLIKSGQFRYVEKDFYAHAHGFVPNDPDLSLQWNIPAIQAEQAWDITLGSSSLIIGIIDTGIDPTHEDLESKLVPGFDFLNNNAIDTSDDEGHGTAVAAAAAAVTDNGLGIAGVCPFCKLMPLRVGDSTNTASYSNIAAAIMYAAENGVRIANVSFGGDQSSSLLQDAVTYAWNNKTLVFSSMSNTGNSVASYPAACTNVVAVGATGQNGTIASFSAYGSWITLVAPGVSVPSAVNGGGYASFSGTSIASPIAAAVAALAVSVNPTISNSDLFTLLQTNSDDLGAPGFDNYYGWGQVDANKLVNAAIHLTGAAPPALSPNQANVPQGQSQQFSVAGSLGGATVTWSITPNNVGSISQTGLYTAPASVTAMTPVTVFAAVNPGPTLVAAANVVPPASGAAAYVRSDTATEGDWMSNYGSDGYLIAGASASLPTYASLAPSNPVDVWSNSTTDPRALVRPPGSTTAGSIAAAWYGTYAVTLDIQFSDTNTHQVAFYATDWDNKSRTETFQVADVQGNILKQQTLSHFQNGAYAVWNLSGHVIVTVKLVSGPTAVVNGIFFGSGSQSSKVSFVKEDTTTQGNWMGAYGSNGYEIAGGGALAPSFAAVGAPSVSVLTWENSTSDVRALQMPSSPSNRVAAAWSSEVPYEADIELTDNAVHRVAFYFVDWDNEGRVENIEMLDANDRVLDRRQISNFSNGTYLVWDLTGHVRMKIGSFDPRHFRRAGETTTPPPGKTSVLSGFFF